MMLYIPTNTFEKNSLHLDTTESVIRKMDRMRKQLYYYAFTLVGKLFLKSLQTL